MKYIIAGLILMITILATKLFLGFYMDDINRYCQNMEKETKQSEDEDRHEELLTIGESVYAVYCTSCHGQNGKGNDGKAHNHTYRISKESVLYAINNGSNNFQSVYPAGMPGGLISAQEAEEVAAFVAKGLQGSRPEAWSVCATCHDESGKGIAFVAPNLKTYSDELVATVLINGKKGAIGRMPAFGDKLSEYQMAGLATYIRSIQKTKE